MDNIKKAYSFLIVASFMMSFTTVLTKLVLNSLNPLSTALYSFGASFIASFIFIKFVKKLDWKTPFKNHWKHMTQYGLLTSIGALIFFYSLDAIGPNLTSFLQRFTIIFTVILGVLFLKEGFNRFEALGMVVAIIGAFVMSYTTENIVIISAILVIIMCALFAFSQLIAKRHIKKIDSHVINHIRITSTFLVLLFVTILSSSLQIPSPTQFLLCSISGIAAGLVGVALFLRALEIAELSKASVVKVLDPFLVVIFSFLVLNDIPTQRQFFGGIIMLLGVSILIIARTKPKIIFRWFT